MKTVVSTDKAPAAIGPYSQAIKTGSMVFVSGQLPLDPATGKMPDDTVEQARQSLTNVKSILEAAGVGLDKVVRVGIFMTDLADFKAVNEVYGTFFTGDCPARATVQVAALPMGAKIEIEATAEL
ncbi:reactive intermediate/imine deaminase [Deltaproteobacteria bacterium Smac51]|nr:reactive intermediate/imine deaminase [Deltaproteobacteria bacterium Smac51]